MPCAAPNRLWPPGMVDDSDPTCDLQGLRVSQYGAERGAGDQAGDTCAHNAGGTLEQEEPDGVLRNDPDCRLPSSDHQKGSPLRSESGNAGPPPFAAMRSPHCRVAERAPSGR
jgi:hypothetical protein